MGRSMTTMAARLPRARRMPRVDTRLAVGIALIVLSLVGGFRLAAAADHTVGVLAVKRDLPANHVLSADDLEIRRVHVPDSVLATLVPADRRDSLRGQVVLFPVASGQLLGQSLVARGATRGREITVPVSPEHALGGHVRVGDRVDVVASFTKSTKDARTLTVAHGAQVVGVERSEGLFGQREGQVSALTLAVPPDDAVFVAFAVRNADVDIVRTNGSTGQARESFDGAQLP